jgi:GalNAc5-diNAcBac-PP-undecaprenol beta-1,3-glucosyltransferase
MIFFSIIIPTYNRAYLIAETIDTVLQQTYPHFEIIIVDDGSTDKTSEFIEKKYRGDTRVKFFYKKNEERGAARNSALKQATGDYAVFFDSDDWMKPHYLDSLNSIIEKQPGIFLLAAKYNYSSGGKTKNNPELYKLAEGWYTRNLFLKGNILACNFCIRIKDCSYIPFPEERELITMEDWLFLLLNMEKEKIFIKDKICLTMRQHEERSMMNNQKVIEARKMATSWALENIVFNKYEQRKLKAWSHYFCGIHQYLDYKRNAAIKEAIAAIAEGGINRKFLILLFKSIVGRKIVAKLK